MPVCAAEVLTYPFMRLAAGILTGYLIFLISATLVFQFSGRDPHEIPTPGFAAFSTIWGMGFACLGGFMATLIAQKKSLMPSIWVGTIIAVLAGAAASVESNKASLWTELTTLILIAPTTVIGGLLGRRRTKVTGA